MSGREFESLRVHSLIMENVIFTMPELTTIINFIQGCKDHSYHPIKKRYIIVQSFIHNGKRLEVNQIISLPFFKMGFTKLHKEQTMFDKNVAILKEYIIFRDQLPDEEKKQLKEITFSPDFTSIRVGHAL